MREQGMEISGDSTLAGRNVSPVNTDGTVPFSGRVTNRHLLPTEGRNNAPGF